MIVFPFIPKNFPASIPWHCEIRYTKILGFILIRRTVLTLIMKFKQQMTDKKHGFEFWFIIKEVEMRKVYTL